MNPFFYYFFPGWAFSLLLVTAFPITSDLFPENDNLFFPEQTESSMMLDGINMSGNTPDTHLFLADSSACLSPSDPQLLRRGLVATRESPGDSCITLDEPKTQSGSRTKNIPDLDLTRLMVIADVKDYWCSATADWGFGNVPVCSVGNSRTYASEEQLADMEILKMQQPTGFKSFVDCSLITPFNFFLCPDDHVYCCNAFLPDLTDPATGFGYWCVQGARKDRGLNGS